MDKKARTKNSKLVMTIDGPAGSGKSTTAKHVAQSLDYLYLDTGAMYRAVTLKVLRNGIKEKDKLQVDDLILQTDVSLKVVDGSMSILLDGVDVSELIRTPDVDFEISWVCQVPSVRDQMVELQRKLGKDGSVVAEGRDMGTVVFPDADLKFYMVAGLEERSQRRWLQMQKSGIKISVDEIKAEIIRRDKIDSQRELSPLHKASDSIEIDTGRLTILQQSKIILDFVDKYINGVKKDG
jgi:CMP/dCMP kinase